MQNYNSDKEQRIPTGAKMDDHRSPLGRTRRSVSPLRGYGQREYAGGRFKYISHRDAESDRHGFFEADVR
jgi:hypothetical protein